MKTLRNMTKTSLIAKVLALIIATSSLSLLLTLTTHEATKVTYEGVTYDKWLKPCNCYGGRLTAALPSTPTTLNWWVAGTDWDLIPLDAIYDRPLRIINGTLTWEIVTGLEFSDDYMVLTLKVREGVKFHDGVELTAEDVAFTINVLAKFSWPYYHGYFTRVDRAEASDKYTVKVYFKTPDASFVYNSLNAMRILPKHIWEPLLNQYGDELAKYSPKPEELVGSGPFKFVEYVPGQYTKFVANENYWLGRPCIDELVYVVITEANTAVLAVQKGEIDVYGFGIDPAVALAIEADPNIEVHARLSESFRHWGLLNTVWPLNISKFRLALSYAIDRETLVNEVLLGFGIPGSPGVVGPFGACAPWYNPDVEKLVYYNPAKAAEILDEIGFTDKDGDGWRDGPNGEPVVIEIYSPTPGYDPIRARVAQLLQEYLAKVPRGAIKAVVYYYEWATLWPMIREGKVMTWLLGSGWANDIGWLYTRFHSWPEGSGNWARYSNSEVDKMLDEIISTFDPQRRKELAWKIQEFLALEAPVINLYYQAFPNPYRIDEFENWFITPSDYILDRVTLLRLTLKQGLCPIKTPTTTPTPSPTQTPTQSQSPLPTATTPTQTATPATTTQQPSLTLTSIPAQEGVSVYMWVAVGAVIVLISIIALFLVKRR
ncbi:MAG: ABC transporter substrate-binding protein [Sulfolobales archaeon]